MSDVNQVEGVNLDEVVQVVKPAKPFVPELPVADIETPLKGIAKRDFLNAVNLTRLGVQRFTVSVEYEIQVGDKDFREAGRDFIDTGVSGKLHIGVMTTATFNKEKLFYIRLADVLRSDGLKNGWTSMRATGIKSFRILSMEPGPLMGAAPLNVGR